MEHTTMHTSPRIGFLGTGLLGLPMAQQLCSAGFPLVAYNRTREKAEPLRDQGATIAAQPADVVAGADCIILMLTDAPAIREVLLADDVRPHLAQRTIIQMGTIRPAESIEISSAVQAAGGDYLEAPVLGSIPQAQQAELIVMVGGTPEQFARWRDLLATFGPEPRHIGPLGQAAAVKLALNQLIGALTGAFSLSLGMVQRHGIDVETFMAILRSSPLYAPTFDKKLPRMLERNFADPNFSARHMLKDMLLVEHEAAALGLNTADIAGLRQLFELAASGELAEMDYSALFAVVVPPEA
jgi:3-hydroxyisobutyrate dehydrogenase